jgi:hypothetical protein
MFEFKHALSSIQMGLSHIFLAKLYIFANLTIKQISWKQI